jgi:hypothetical protein
LSQLSKSLQICKLFFRMLSAINFVVSYLKFKQFLIMRICKYHTKDDGKLTCSLVQPMNCIGCQYFQLKPSWEQGLHTIKKQVVVSSRVPESQIVPTISTVSGITPPQHVRISSCCGGRIS